MGFWDRYHEKRIGRLSEMHPEVSLSNVRADYHAYLENRGFISAVGQGVVELSYGLDVINMADSSLPERLMRGLDTIIRTLIEE